MAQDDDEAAVVETTFAQPAWRRATHGESRWTVIVAVAVAVVLQVVLPNRFSAGHRAVPVLELFLVIGVWVAHPHKTGGELRAGCVRRVSC